MITKHKNGTLVRTTQRKGTEADERRNWAASAIPTRRWGVDGKIIMAHDGHGLCYSVRHLDDSTVGFYDHEELELSPAVFA